MSIRQLCKAHKMKWAAYKVLMRRCHKVERCRNSKEEDIIQNKISRSTNNSIRQYSQVIRIWLKPKSQLLVIVRIIWARPLITQKSHLSVLDRMKELVLCKDNRREWALMTAKQDWIKLCRLVLRRRYRNSERVMLPQPLRLRKSDRARAVTQWINKKIPRSQFKG